MRRVAMMSQWHVHAEGYAKELLEIAGVSIPYVWDEDARRGEAWARELGAQFVPDYRELLQREDVDAVAVCSPTSMHPELIGAAARAKKHIFTEKVLALTAEDARELAGLIGENGVEFCISLPQRTRPVFLYAKQVVDSGVLGQITMMRVQNGHTGSSDGWLPEYWYDPETTGGGAMMDLGAHPMYLSAYLLGKPKAVNSMFTYPMGRQVEDCAVCSILFENGAVAVSQSALATAGCPYQMELFGTKGSLLIREDEAVLTTEGVARTVPAGSFPAARDSALVQWVRACQGGPSAEFTAQDAVELSVLMEGAYRAAKEQRTISFSQI
ncbi:MAG: Gfo/Idh/MocA family oxidoreductase [Oscillospiraceae bacterium]|nr:Gfo/Idh/MocA family oxidoreductase [Oscillospiraceae bacterium]